MKIIIIKSMFARLLHIFKKESKGLKTGVFSKIPFKPSEYFDNDYQFNNTFILLTA